jgi:hypothetical protein
VNAGTQMTKRDEKRLTTKDTKITKKRAEFLVVFVFFVVKPIDRYAI